MKKLFAPFILLAAAVIFLPSCSNSSKLAFTKRHYRSGYYVDIVGKSHTNIAASTAKLPIHQITPIEITKLESYVGVNTAVPVSGKTVIVEKSIVPKEIKESNLLTINSTAADKNSFILNTWGNSGVSGSAGDGNHERSVSVPFVVVVLCAIFIPPLGVGLMYGLNSYFWIDLILTLLFFFPGMIFAIIVVLM